MPRPGPAANLMTLVGLILIAVGVFIPIKAATSSSAHGHLSGYVLGGATSVLIGLALISIIKYLTRPR